MLDVGCGQAVSGFLTNIQKSNIRPQGRGWRVGGEGARRDTDRAGIWVVDGRLSNSDADRIIAGGPLIRLLHEIVPTLIFESRLRFVESGDSSAWLRPRLTNLDNQISQIVSHHTQRLKVAFGDSRFQQLDAWVRSPQSQHCFVRPCTAENR